MPFFIEHREGRLVEYAMVGEISDHEMRDFRTHVWALMSRIRRRTKLERPADEPVSWTEGLDELRRRFVS